MLVEYSYIGQTYEAKAEEIDLCNIYVYNKEETDLIFWSFFV